MKVWGEMLKCQLPNYTPDSKPTFGHGGFWLSFVFALRWAYQLHIIKPKPSRLNNREKKKD